MILINATSPRSKKRKPTAKQRELSSSWDAMMKKYATKTVVPKERSLSTTYSLGTPAGRETPRHPSRDTGLANAVYKPNPVYTGSMVKGISTMHKSNAVPVFSQEEAIEISKMRRG